jgi:hypothetical protein
VRGNGLVPIALAASLAAGCGADDEPSEQPGPASTPSTQMPRDEPVTDTRLDGSYRATIPRSAARRYPKVPLQPGRWTLIVQAPTMDFTGPDGSVQVQFQFDGDALITSANTGCVDRRGRLDGGRYRVTRSDGALRFRALDEPCGEHRFVFTSARWRKG